MAAALRPVRRNNTGSSKDGAAGNSEIRQQAARSSRPEPGPRRTILSANEFRAGKLADPVAAKISVFAGAIL
jgi:hypothetical protein